MLDDDDSDRLIISDKLIISNILIISDSLFVRDNVSDKLSLHLCSRWKEGEGKGGCRILLVGAREYRELELPLGWILLLRGL
jgi:hypothetical protein